MSKIYTGKRIKCGEVEIRVDGKILTPDRSLKLRNHSPTGFEWGYGGSGPSQLALAIMLDIYDPDTALEYYQEFKWTFVSRFEFDGFVLSEDDVNQWLSEYRAQKN